MGTDLLPYRIHKKAHGVASVESEKPLTVLAIPDLHAPFQHPDALRFLTHIKNEHKPDLVICLGDEIDFAALSFHDKDPEMPGPVEEYKCALDFMLQLYKVFPNVMTCRSNHTDRPFRVAFKAGLPSQMLRSYAELFKAPPGWSWHDRIVVDNTCYIHGDPRCGEGAARAWLKENRMSTVIGHVHGHAGVGYSQSPFNQSFWMNAGCLIDLEAMAFRYGSKYANKGTLGCGLIYGGHSAYFVPMR